MAKNIYSSIPQQQTLTLLLGNVLWKGSMAKGSDFAGEDDKPAGKTSKKVKST